MLRTTACGLQRPGLLGFHYRCVGVSLGGVLPIAPYCLCTSQRTCVLPHMSLCAPASGAHCTTHTTPAPNCWSYPFHGTCTAVVRCACTAHYHMLYRLIQTCTAGRVQLGDDHVGDADGAAALVRLQQHGHHLQCGLQARAARPARYVCGPSSLLAFFCVILLP